MLKKLGLLVAILLSFVSSIFAEDKVVKIGFPGTNNFLFGVAGIAQDKKFIEDELKKIGYILEYKPFAAAGPAVNEALATKAIDIAFYADFPGLVSKSKGIPHTLIGIYDDFINAAVIVEKNSKIKSIKELKGKKIGFIKGTYMHKVLYQLLSINGLKPSDVELINVVDGESALISKTIDAYVTTDDSEAIAVITKKFAKTIDSSKKHPEFSAQGVIVGRDAYLKDNPEVAVAIHKALIKAKQFWIKNADQGYQILTKSGKDLPAVKSVYAKDKNKFEYATLKITNKSIEKLQKTVEFLLENDLIKNNFDVKTWANNSYFDKANNGKI